MDPQSNASAALAAELTPSDETLAQTLAVVGTRLTRFAADGASAQATIEKLDAALASMSGGPAVGQSWDMGALALPVQGAWKAVTALVSKVMTETTGVSVDSWADVLAGGRATFDDYLIKLRAVVGLGALAEADLAVVDEARLATTGWRTAMGPVAEFARLLDSMVAEMTRRVNAAGEGALAKPAVQANWMGQVQRAQQRIGEVVDVAAEKLHLTRADMVQLVIGPLQSVKDRAARLPGELEALHHEVSVLEDLLKLLEAQVRSARGELARGEVEVAALIFAAAVRVPRLAADLTETRAELAAVDSYLLGLGRMRHESAVTEPTALILETEYLARGNTAHARLQELERRARSWEEHGPALLHGGLNWVVAESEVADVRLAVGQWTHVQADQRRQYLLREQGAMERALDAIGQLNPPPVPLPGA